ncbi:MAG: TIGR02996 domain-containing protein, partial [Gemmataceae bacterium]|nr:TIGR02996 domain-containing protein [Gemmataceae bacterium]
MREHAALLAAIVAHPDEDTPRLAYADWLDENRPDTKPSPAQGPSARAEFIRVQCRLAAIAPDDPDYPDLLDREHDLQTWLGAHDPDTVKLPAGLQGDDGPFRRGFLSQVASEYGWNRPKAVARLCAALVKAFATTTADALRLYAYTPTQTAELIRSPVAGRVRTLLLQSPAGDEFPTPDDGPTEDTPGAAEVIARALADSPHLGRLGDLRLFFPLSAAAAGILADAKTLDGLSHLTIMFGPDAVAAVAALGRAGWFRDLRSLRIGQYLGDETATALAGLSRFPHLHTLDLSHNDFTPDGLAALATSKAFPTLVALDLSHSMTRLTVAHLVALGRANWKLAVLNLRSCGRANDGVALLAASRLLEGVRVADLAANAIGAGGMKALAKSPHVASLRHLDLE